MTERRKIRWLIAHFPQYLFVRTAKAFKHELEKLCPGEFEIEILTMSEYADQYNKHPEFKSSPPVIAGLDGKVNTNDHVKTNTSWAQNAKKWAALFQALGDDEFQLSQTQISIIGNELDKNFHAIDLPFLFDDHDHVTRVLDGDIGNKLCTEIGQKTPITALAFTYSGGYRVIGSNTKITNLSDLANTNLLTQTAHSVKLFEEIGAKPVRRLALSGDQLADVANDPAASVETTYLRFSGKHVYKTEHSMFTTSILTGNKFWNSLTNKQQDAFRIAAKKTAKHERKWSIDDAKKYEDLAQENGVEIIGISEQDRAVLQQAALLTYQELESLGIDPILVQSIIAQRNSHIQ